MRYLSFSPAPLYRNTALGFLYARARRKTQGTHKLTPLHVPQPGRHLNSSALSGSPDPCSEAQKSQLLGLERRALTVLKTPQDITRAKARRLAAENGAGPTISIGRGLEVVVEGDRLRYKPRSAVDPELRERLVAHKAELLHRLKGEAARTPILQSRVLGRGPYGVEIVEIAQLDPPGPTRWERRISFGAVGLVTDATRDPRLAQTWLRTLRDRMEERL